jgi:ADP-ribose pyrophosphatase
MQGIDAHLRWGEHSRRRVARCSLFDLYAIERSSARGNRGEFWVLAAPDWVNIVPVLKTDAGEPALLMVRQYRHGAELITTEFPAGLIEPGEAPSVAAARELEEETGYRAGRLTLLNTVAPNPAFMNNLSYTFLAEDLERVGDVHLDDLEALEPRIVPVAEIERDLGTGELVNSLTVLGFLWYRSRGTQPR